jgi:hypothetical protein
MNDEVLLSRKLHVDNIDPELYLQFKLCLLQKNLTMREVVIDYLEAFVASVKTDAKKAKRR